MGVVEVEHRISKGAQNETKPENVKSMDQLLEKIEDQDKANLKSTLEGYSYMTNYPPMLTFPPMSLT